MRFPRNARIFRGQLDVTPFACVFFLLLMFLMLSRQVYTPGVKIELPVVDELPGTEMPTVNVAMDATGRLYFRNQLVKDDEELKFTLRKAALEAGGPVALVIQADQRATQADMTRLMMLARDAGIHDFIQATMPKLKTSVGPSVPSP